MKPSRMVHETKNYSSKLSTIDKYAMVWSSNEQIKLSTFIRGLIKDCKLNSEAQVSPITIQMLELEYDKINNTYDNSANILLLFKCLN